MSNLWTQRHKTVVLTFNNRGHALRVLHNAEHEFKIRSLQNREKLQNLAIQTAELRLKRLEARPTAPKPSKTAPGT